MEMRILAIGLALGLASFLLSTGCSQQDATTGDSVQEMSTAVEEQIEKAEAVVAEDVHRLAAAVEPKPRRQGKETIIEDGAQGDEIRLEYAGKAAKSAYNQARARAAGQFDNARDVFDKD